jgi:hypothetical protein
MSTAVTRSRRRTALESFLHTFLLTSPYRCHECKSRFLRFHLPAGRAASTKSAA